MLYQLYQKMNPLYFLDSGLSHCHPWST